MLYIIKHQGFNRQGRRHNPEIKLYIEESERTGHLVPKNKPYIKRR